MASLQEFSEKPGPGAFEQPSHPYDPKHYARTRFAVFPDDFIELENPTGATLTGLLYLGPLPTTMPVQQRRQDDPDEGDDLDATLDATRRAAVLKHQQSLFVKFTFKPGDRIMVPKRLVSALVSVREGVVVGGHIPQLRIPNDPNPPVMHPTLEPHSGLAADPFRVPGAQ